MKEINLSNSPNKVIVDDEDYDKIIKIAKSIFQCKNGHIYINTHNEIIQLARFVMQAKHEEYVDHIYHNLLDNRKSKLRICTNQQNNFNRRPNKGTSKFKGVSWDKRYQKWRAVIMINYKQKWIGYFNNEIDAAKAYDEEAKANFGDFAWLNFPGV